MASERVEEITAPKYNELYQLVSEQRAKLRQLEDELAQVNAKYGETSLNTKANDESIEFRVIPDVNKSVKCFTGSEPSHVAEDWLETIEGLADLNQWPFKFRLHFVRSNMSDAARNWFLSKNFVSWSTFRERFKLVFVRELRMADKWDAMRSRVQHKDESLMSYFQDKVRLCKGVRLPFEEIRDYVLQGILSRELAMYAFGRKHDDEDQLLIDILEWQRQSDRRGDQPNTPVSTKVDHGKMWSKKETTSNQSEPSKFTSATRTIMKTESPTSDSRHSTVKCYNCSGFGHIARDCPRPKRPMKCSLCSAEGHTRGKCPSVKQEHPAQMCQVVVAECAGKNPFGKQVKINQVEFSGLIDSGSTVCLIRSSAAVRTKLPIVSSIKPLYAVGDMKTPRITSLAEIMGELVIDGVKTDKMQFLVVEDKAIPVEVLIGQSWLNLPQIAYHKQDDTFVVEYADMDVEAICGNVNKHEHGVQVCLVQEQSTSKVSLSTDDVIIGSQVDSTQKEELTVLLNKYRAVFALNLQELGCTDLVTMEITEEQNSKPVSMKPYRTSEQERRQIAEITEEWVRSGIISETRSPYASPVILVNKANGKKRLCVDFRRLNRQTISQPYPMPDVDSQLSSLSAGKMFCTLDLSNGYLQIPLAEAAKDKTSFITPDAVYRFERMPFGLKNAPAEFCRLMDQVLGTLKREGVVRCYIDDVIIPATDWGDMCKKVGRVFQALERAKLTLNPTKCAFGVTELDYLGFNIKEGQLRPGRKIAVIENYPEPNNVHELRRFLGLTGYFRRFITHYADISAPLTALTKKDQPWKWMEAQQGVFEQLKRTLTSAPVLKLYNHESPVTEVHTDASAKGLSGMLMQGDTEKSLHLVYAVSKRTTEAESHYHSSRLELYAIVWTLIRLRPYLLGIRFTVVTDCQALVYLNTNKSAKPQVARWFDLLQEFEMNIKYRSGEQMAHVDALSRLEGTTDSAQAVEETLDNRSLVMTLMTLEERVRYMQQADPDTCQLINILEKGEGDRTPYERNAVNKFKLLDGVLYRELEGISRFVVPKPLRKGIVIMAHDMAGHRALDQTLKKIQEHYWFSKMRRYVQMHIGGCLDCLVNKKPGGKQSGELYPIPPGKRPFAVVHLDHLGPFETSLKGNKFLLVLIDNLTKYVLLFPAKSTHTQAAIRSLQKFVSQWGLPDRLITDRGTCFTSKAFQDYCRHNGIRHTLNSSRHPQANGQVERTNRTLLPMLAIQAQDQKLWDQKLREVERDINNTESKTTKYTPFELIHGYRPQFHSSVLRLLDGVGTHQHLNAAELQVKARDNILKTQVSMKERYDQKRNTSISYEVGEMVAMLRAPNPGQSTKLQTKYRGPLQIIGKLPGNTYRVAEMARDGKHIYATTAHVSQLKAVSIMQEEQVEEKGSESSADEDEEINKSNADLPRVDGTVKLKRQRKPPKYLKDYV